jgi:hypothetical protein
MFITFFPLGAACNRKMVFVVANENVGYPRWADHYGWMRRKRTVQAIDFPLCDCF